MRDLLDQIEKSLQSELYYLSLIATLAVPDMAGALDSPDGRAIGKRYTVWYDKWVRPQYAQIVQPYAPPGSVEEWFYGEKKNPLSGAMCYAFRCSLLHQGRAQFKPIGRAHRLRAPVNRIIFIEPSSSSGAIHYMQWTDSGALLIDLRHYCREVLQGARKWLDHVEPTALYRSNSERFVRRHPEGLVVGGVPVIG